VKTLIGVRIGEIIRKPDNTVLATFSTVKPESSPETSVQQENANSNTENQETVHQENQPSAQAQQ
jgi:DNA primase